MPDPSFRLPLTADLDSDIGTSVTASYSRSGAIWYLDPDDGAYKQAATNTAAHSSLGILLEPTRTNRLEGYNAPAAGEDGGWSVDGNGTKALVADSADTLTDAGLGNITNGYFHRFTNNGSQSVATLTGQADTTNRTAFSFWYRLTGAARFRLQLGTEYEIPASSEWAYFKVEDITPGATTDQAKLELDADGQLDFVLQQLENDSATAYTGVGATNPIIVAGAEASRNVFNLTLQLASSILPTQDFAIALDVKPNSDYQWGGAAYYLDIAPSGSENLEFIGPGKATREVGNDIVTATAFNMFREQKYTVAVWNGGEHGFEVFANGFGSMQRTLIAAVDSSLQTYNMRIGRSAGSDSYFNGWLGNLRIYDSDISADFLKNLTRNYGGVTLLDPCGPPVYDPNTSGRIWALGIDPQARPGTATEWRYKNLQYSDDWGDTWTVVKSLASSGGSPEDSLIGTLNISRSGDFYYSRGNSTGSLMKIDGSTYAVSAVIADWDNDGSNGAGGSDLGKTWSYLPWLWGEDDNNIYTGAYMTSASGAGDRYWYSSDDGENWTLKNLSITDARHIHSMHVDPNTDRLWFTVGDGDGRTTGWTDDNLDTSLNDVSSSEAGETGISFSTEAVWLFTDEAGGTGPNYINSSDGSSVTNRWTAPSPHNGAPIYYGRLRGDNEVWLSGYAESTNEDTKFSYIAKLTKHAHVNSQWRVQAMYILGHRFVNGLNPYTISHDTTGVVPNDAPYVFVDLSVDNEDRDAVSRKFIYDRVVRISVTASFESEGADPLAEIYARASASRVSASSRDTASTRPEASRAA